MLFRMLFRMLMHTKIQESGEGVKGVYLRLFDSLVRSTDERLEIQVGATRGC
jgi:hypothetical protein